MRKTSTRWLCHAAGKAVMILCCLLYLHAYHAAAQAPTYTSSPVTTATVGQPYQYSVQATDPNNLPLTFSAGNLPSWLIFSTAGQSTSSQYGGTVSSPGGVAGDAAGNIYVTENYGTKIYKITPDGTMTHWATRPLGSVYAMLVVGDDLLVSYYSISSTNRITKINLSGTPVETPWISSPALNNPLSMVERNGFLFVADYGAGKLRKVNLNTGAVNDVLTLSGIFGLGFNSAGTLYLASYGLRKIYTADVTSGNPQATLTEVLNFTANVTDVKIDNNDNVYISANGFVRKYNPSLTSFTPCWSGSGWVWGMSLTPGGTLVFGLYSANMVHRLQTGAVLSGMPALADIGVHNVSLDVTNGNTSSTQNFSVAVSGPSTFQTTAITVPFGTAPFTLPDPASNSNGAFTFTSSNNSVASINGNTMTIAGMGTATITATQAAAGLYLQTQQTFTLTVTAPAPTFGSWPGINKVRNDAPFILTDPASNSNGTFTYTSSDQQVATISGNAVTITGIGTATITASQAAAGNYAQGSTTTTLTVTSGVPVIGAWTLAGKAFGEAPFMLTDPTSNSSGSFSYTSSNPQVATINNNVVTIVGAGNTDITATQAANGSFSSGSVTATLNVSPAAPVLGNWNLAALQYGEPAFQLTDPVSNSSGNFSYSTSDPAVASVSGNTVTITGVGTATITATQAATGNYTGGSVQAVLTVNAATPVLGNMAPVSKTFGDAPFLLTTPASNSNGQFSYTSSNPAVATVSNNTITIVGAGTSVITATQAATANYTSASATATLTVAKANPVLGSWVIPAKVFGAQPFALTAPQSNSGGSFTYTSSDDQVALINGNTITIVGAGTANITASQAAGSHFNEGSVQATLQVSKATPQISALQPVQKEYGTAPFTLPLPQSNSNGGFVWTSANNAVATVSGNSVTVTGTGTVVLTATQAATAHYNSGQAAFTLTVAKASPSVGAISNLNKVYGDAAFVLPAPRTNSSGTWRFTSSNASVASLNGSTVAITGAGATEITATLASDANYHGAAVTAVLTVAKAPLQVKVDDAYRCVQMPNPQFNYAISGYVNGENETVLASKPQAGTAATQNSGAGTYAITASGAQAANYTISYVAGTLTVNNPQNSARRLPVVNAIAGESTPLSARMFGTRYQWSPVTGLSNSRVAMPTAQLQNETTYTIATTEATGCVVTDTLQVRTFSKPDVFVPSLFSPNGDGVNDELRINPVGMKQLYYFRIFDRSGRLLFDTRNLNEGWNGRFRSELLRMGTYSWILSGLDKNGKWITTSGSVTLAR